MAAGELEIAETDSSAGRFLCTLVCFGWGNWEWFGCCGWACDIWALLNWLESWNGCGNTLGRSKYCAWSRFTEMKHLGVRCTLPLDELFCWKNWCISSYQHCWFSTNNLLMNLQLSEGREAWGSNLKCKPLRVSKSIEPLQLCPPAPQRLRGCSCSTLRINKMASSLADIRVPHPLPCWSKFID